MLEGKPKFITYVKLTTAKEIVKNDGNPFKIVTFRLGLKDDPSAPNDTTTWIDISAQGIESLLKSGPIVIDEIESRSWTGNDGSERVSQTIKQARFDIGM